MQLFFHQIPSNTFLVYPLINCKIVHWPSCKDDFLEIACDNLLAIIHADYKLHAGIYNTDDNISVQSKNYEMCYDIDYV